MQITQLDMFPSQNKQEVIQGDCLEVMRGMADNSIDFIVTDPPYGLSFMNKKWDCEVPLMEYWREVFRICKPGSMAAVFGGSRTHHHLMLAMEAAGWEIRDVIMWVYGSGFPKSHNNFGLKGYGTSLKPAYEPIIIAMRPLDGTFAQNAEKWGVAGINIDDCRIIPTVEDARAMERCNTTGSGRFKSGKFGSSGKDGFGDKSEPYNTTKGRWPANIIFDEEAAKELDEMTGDRPNGYRKNNSTQSNSWFTSNKGDGERGYKDSGGASRFFYCAKASSSERNRGLDKPCSHPTVKPIALMKYILKLLAPPGNPTCLDPFAGSGSTLLAAKELGIRCIGIEKEAEYCEIARKRISSDM